jgi:hypothetical protein
MPAPPFSHNIKMEVLHSSRFAYNCRVLETRLHRKFHSAINRLWSHVGAGSYYLSEQALLHQKEYALISKVFIVYAPLSVIERLHFRMSVPMHAVVHFLELPQCEDENFLPEF